jgi:preprotein translocase SecE subunit
MAVAVKNTPGTSAPSILDRPWVVSLLGVLYVTVMLGIVFAGVPALVEMLGLRTSQLVGGSVAALGMLLAAAGLIYLGGRLLGPHQIHGVRAGIVVGLLGVVVVLLLTRWASLWFEYGAFYANWFGPSGQTTGAVLTGVAGLLFLLAFVYLFVQGRTQRIIGRLEDGGWFHATRYKPLQGVRVRWATVAGILILGGTGVYTLITHGTLNRGPNDWQLDIPFTGRVAINYYGDTASWLNRKLTGDSPVEVTWPGASELQLHPHQVSTVDGYRQAVRKVPESEAFATGSLEPVREAINKALADEKNVTGLLLTVNQQIYDDISFLLDPKKNLLFNQNTIRSLEELKNRVTTGGETLDDISSLIAEVKRQAERSPNPDQFSPVYRLPTALVLLDRYVLRDINHEVEQYVRINLIVDESVRQELKRILKSDEDPVGKEIPNRDVEAALDQVIENRLQQVKLPVGSDAWEERKKEITNEVNKSLVRQTLYSASGPTEFRSLTLLPAVPYTLPLLLLLLSAWLAWRAVNLPAFADFLIATEAELNKVSWTTQKRLVQDTIVVLVTVVLMAVYLFGVDQLWRVSLSWDYIRVLVIPKDPSSTNRSVENKNW